MSTEKLIELSKPVMYVVRTLDGSVASVKSHSYTAPKGFTSETLYSQEYVSALLAELEAKDKRIEELERITEGVDQLAIDGGWTARGISEYAKSLGSRLEKWQELASNQCIKINELQNKLATPVRLPTTSCRLGVAYTRVIPEVIEAIRAAGFKCVGDE